MNIKRKVIATLLSGLAIAGFVAAAALAIPQVSNAQTSTPPATTSATDRPVRGSGSHDKYLAEALGITQEDLTAARTKAREAAIQQAVKDGLITQAQADALLNKSGSDVKGARTDLRGVKLDSSAQLAAALGISVEKLQAAEAAAAKAELAQAVTDGRLTQAQADQITAERALQNYITEKGFYKSAVESAVKDGVITQAQADTILSQNQSGMFGGLGRGGKGDARGGHGGGRGPGMDGAGAPGAQP